MTKREELIKEIENIKYKFGCSESAEKDEENHRILKNNDELVYMNGCPQAYKSTENSAELCETTHSFGGEICQHCWENALEE